MALDLLLKSCVIFGIYAVPGCEIALPDITKFFDEFAELVVVAGAVSNVGAVCYPSSRFFVRLRCGVSLRLLLRDLWVLLWT